MTSRIELVPMSTAARRGGGGATARAGVAAAPPVAAGTLVWAVALALLPERWGGREMAPPAAPVNAPPGSRISPLCNGCAKPGLDDKRLLHGENRGVASPARNCG